MRRKDTLECSFGLPKWQILRLGWVKIVHDTCRDTLATSPPISNWRGGNHRHAQEHICLASVQRCLQPPCDDSEECLCTFVAVSCMQLVGRRLLILWITFTAPKPLHFDWTTTGMPNPVVMFVDAVFPPVLTMCTFRQVPDRVYSDSFETSSRRRSHEMMMYNDSYESDGWSINSHEDLTPVSQASPPPITHPCT